MPPFIAHMIRTRPIRFQTLLPRLQAFVAPHRRRLLLILGVVGLLTGVELLKPWPIQFVIDRMLAPSTRQGAVLAWYPIALACGGIVAIALVSAGLTLLHNYLGVRLGQEMVHELRARLYSHLQRLSLAFYARQALGDLLYRVTADTYAIQTLTMNAVLPLCSSVVMLLSMAVIMLYLDPLLTAVALTVCPVLLVVMMVLNARIADAGLRARQSESSLYSVVQRVMSSIRVIQAFCGEEREQRTFVAASREGLSSRLRLYTLQTLYSGVVAVIMAAGTATVVGVGALHVAAGSLTVGELVVFLAYLASLYGPVNTIVQTNGLIQEAKAGVQRVFELLDVAQQPRDGAVRLTECRGHICFERVSFEYRAGEPVLHDVNLRVESGETVAIVGSTGAGKSTLISLIGRFYDPGSGRILLDGCDLRDYRIADVRRHISFVLQPPLIFPLSVRDNIAYGRPDASMDEIRAAAVGAGIDRRIEQLPQGYETVLGDAVCLSEGERQRLTIARALLRDAPLLILDEPTSSVDVETEAAIMETLQRLKGKRTCFIIAHRLATVREADRIVVLERGRIIEEGTHEALLARQGRYAGLYHSHVSA